MRMFAFSAEIKNGGYVFCSTNTSVRRTSLGRVFSLDKTAAAITNLSKCIHIYLLLGWLSLTRVIASGFMRSYELNSSFSLNHILVFGQDINPFKLIYIVPIHNDMTVDSHHCVIDFPVIPHTELAYSNIGEEILPCNRKKPAA